MSRLIKIVAGVGVAIAAVAVAALMWWILRDEGPAAVDLETAVARVEAGDGAPSSAEPAAAVEQPAPTTATTGAPTTTSGADPDASAATAPTADPTTTSTAEVTVTSSAGPDPSAATSSTKAGGDAPTTDTAADTTMADVAGAAFAGVWTVATAAGDLSDEPAVSFAGYRVVEVLAGGVDESTAVGRTTGVTGSIELSATDLVAATVEVDMSTLRTDNSHRDSHARKSLNTKEFPLAVFELAEPVELPAEVYEGEPFSASARGDLTIKGITNRVGFDLQAQLVDGTIVVVGSTEVVFADYGVTAPTSPSVISVEDHGIMEFQLYLVRPRSDSSEDE